MSLTGAASASVITDATGAFRFMGLPNGAYTLSCQQDRIHIHSRFAGRSIAGSGFALTFASTATVASISHYRNDQWSSCKLRDGDARRASQELRRLTASGNFTLLPI